MGIVQVASFIKSPENICSLVSAQHTYTHTLPIYILLHPSKQLAVNSPLSHGSLGSFNFFKTERKRETRQERNRFDKKRKKKQKLRDRTTQENNTKMKN